MIATLDVPKEVDETDESVGAALGSRQSAASTLSHWIIGDV